VFNGMGCVAPGVRGAPATARAVLGDASAEGPRAIVMGLDQHRAQITAEWIDTATGEIGRARVTPAHRESVRRFLGRFVGHRLEVALEATTGWRFVVEELRAIGAAAHLAEPAETSARRGNKKRAKTDRADARHLRELLMIGRLPESWIPPAHLLDLRARVRLRHTLSDQRGEADARRRRASENLPPSERRSRRQRPAQTYATASSRSRSLDLRSCSSSLCSHAPLQQRRDRFARRKQKPPQHQAHRRWPAEADRA
jgi:hypothetical protein